MLLLLSQHDSNKKWLRVLVFLCLFGVGLNPKMITFLCNDKILDQYLLNLFLVWYCYLSCCFSTAVGFYFSFFGYDVPVKSVKIGSSSLRFLSLRNWLLFVLGEVLFLPLLVGETTNRLFCCEKEGRGRRDGSQIEKEVSDTISRWSTPSTITNGAKNQLCECTSNSFATLELLCSTMRVISSRANPHLRSFHK